MTANSARHELHSRLVALEKAARKERDKLRLPHSRRDVANTAGKEPFNTPFDSKRISDWVPATAADAHVPYDPEPAAFLALVQVWSAWAGQRYRKHEWVALLADARRERATAAPPAATLRTTLPAAPAGFCGRADHVDAVLDALAPSAEGPTAVCLAGLPGVGKTALALVAAHRAQQQGLFTTALFVDLLGYHAPSADPADLLAILLRGIGADVSEAGSSAAEREAAYRFRLAELTRAEQPVVIVADNAADAAAVRPLLPPPGPHRLLVTSRHTLHALDARLIDLPVLSDGASAELLATALRTADPTDARRHTAPDVLTALARLCGGLPLALRIAAALLIREPHLTAAELTKELVEIGPLEGLDDGEQAVRTALARSYQRLPPDLAEVFILLVLNPGPDVSTEAAEVLTGLRRPVLRRRLAELSRAHLVDGTQVAGRWRMHDLIRAFATEHMHARQQSPAEGLYGRPEQQRLLRHYRARVDAADVWIRGFTLETEDPVDFPDLSQALEWLDAEHVNLVGAVVAAAATGNSDEAVGLALGLSEYLQHRLLNAEKALVSGIAEQVAQDTVPTSAAAGQPWQRTRRHPAARQGHRAARAGVETVPRPRPPRRRGNSPDAHRRRAPPGGPPQGGDRPIPAGTGHLPADRPAIPPGNRLEQPGQRME
jgi:hypothetical protein